MTSGGSKVKVLPALSAPVSLSDSATADADKLIEELMLEAERDPGLRELSGLNKKQAAAAAEMSSSQNYPLVKRPYRTQQDMIIKDETDISRQQQQHKMFTSRAYNRSKSADARPASAAAARAKQTSSRAAPPPGEFKRTASTDNIESGMLGEVVTDNARHHSVKDLVAMIEKNTKSESANAYVRKWGCDLISPEPHTRNVTYRREKKQFENGDQADSIGMKRLTTYNWTKDDEFQRKHLIGLEESMATSHPQRPQYSSNYDDSFGDGEFRLSSHVTDLDSLLGRTRNDEGDIEVQWPPTQSNMTSPAPPLQPPSPEPQYRQQDFHIPKHVTIEEGGDQHDSSRFARQQQLQYNKYQSSGVQSQYQGQDMVDIDRQIKSIQNEFDSELDTLIDSYRQVQKTVGMCQRTSEC